MGADKGKVEIGLPPPASKRGKAAVATGNWDANEPETLPQ